MFKLFMLAIIYFIILHGNCEENIREKITKTLSQGGKVKVCSKILIRLIMTPLFLIGEGCSCC